MNDPAYWQFVLGMFLGGMLGGAIGVLLMAIFASGKRR